MAECKSSLTVKARLSNAVLNEKLGSSHVSESEKEQLRIWFLTSRLVFGEDSISCRLVSPVLNALRGHHQASDLIKILLAKLPTISMVAAEQFVSAFLSFLEGPEGSCVAGSPFSLLFKVAALESRHDGDVNSACSFPEFMTLLPRHIHQAPPFLRLMCWCAYITHLRVQNGEEIAFQQHNNFCVGLFAVFWGQVVGLLYPFLRRSKRPYHTKDLSVISSFEYVDQNGLPFLLRECSKGNAASGYAFSWGGDHESIQDVTF